MSNLHLYHVGKQKMLGERMVASKFEPHDNWLPPCYHVPADLETALIESGVPSTHWNMAQLSGLVATGAGSDAKDLSKEELCSIIRKKAGVTAVADGSEPKEAAQDPAGKGAGDGSTVALASSTTRTPPTSGSTPG